MTLPSRRALDPLEGVLHTPPRITWAVVVTSMFSSLAWVRAKLLRLHKVLHGAYLYSTYVTSTILNTTLQYIESRSLNLQHVTLVALS